METSEVPPPSSESTVPMEVNNGPHLVAGAEGDDDIQTKENETKPDENEGAVGGAAAVVEEGQDVTSCLKTLTDSHNAVEVKLQEALAELALKQKIYDDLKEDLDHRKGKNRLMQERVQSLDEKLFFLKASVGQREKQQEGVFTEIADVKWKIEDATRLRTKLLNEHKVMKKKAQKRKEQFAMNEDPKGILATRRKELQDYIDKLEDYKKRLQGGDPEAMSVMDGSKLKEVEQSKQALREAVNDREARCDSLHVTIDEKTVQVTKHRRSLENAKEFYGSEIRQIRSKLQYTKETNLRLERSFDYLQQKIDYGMHVPAPPPWPYVKK